MSRRISVGWMSATWILAIGCGMDADSAGEVIDPMPSPLPHWTCETDGDTDADCGEREETTSEGSTSDDAAATDSCEGSDECPEGVCVASFDEVELRPGVFTCAPDCIETLDDMSWCRDAAGCCDPAAICTPRGYCLVMTEDTTGS